ncbi:MAG: diphosphomevalonate decarboxylase [Saprospiraceae bacterium]|nr:diphosphomevalonate decarboxylase [Saprospiraceae bacterium]
MSDYTNPALIVETSNTEAGRIRWTSPSNIALIKYWGKHGKQLPQNPSISFTLDRALTDTTLSWEPKSGVDKGFELEFLFDGEEKLEFKEKVQGFLESLNEVFPFLRQLHLKIDTRNSFPHSAGIASSASAMSALSLCLCSLEHELFGTLESDEAFQQKASYISRLGSGSACRSIYGGAAVWGKTSSVEGSSDEFAVEVTPMVEETFRNFFDSILIVSKSEKSVSSRAGHALMDGNPFSQARYQQARQRLDLLIGFMEKGDLEGFGRIVENEALTLHALMMASNPSYLLMEPNTLAIIQKVRAFRKETNTPVYFTLDAGPNIHLLYPASVRNNVVPFIIEELVPLCQDEMWIDDRVGVGPVEQDLDED